MNFVVGDRVEDVSARGIWKFPRVGTVVKVERDGAAHVEWDSDKHPNRFPFAFRYGSRVVEQFLAYAEESEL